MPVLVPIETTTPSVAGPLSGADVTWRDLTIDAHGQSYRIINIDGWEDLPPARYDKQNRSRAHGSHRSPVWADERIVTVTGTATSASDRDALLTGLQQRFTFDGDVEDLTITLAGRTLTAGAQLLRFAPAVTVEEWPVGHFGWIAQWRCPDPLRYGPAVPVSTGLPTEGGGLDYGTAATGLVYDLDYGDPGTRGKVTVSNVDGTAEAPVLYTVTGPLLGGYEVTVVETGERNRFIDPVQAGQQWVDVDTGAGTVLLNGTADRRARMVVADWFTVPPGETRTLAFSTLGAYDSAATLAATTAPTYW